MIAVAEEKGVPAVGLQTFFRRDAVLVHSAGVNWWKVLRDMPLSDADADVKGVESESDATGNPLFGQHVPSLPPDNRARVWVSRIERAVRSAFGTGYQRNTEGLFGLCVDADRKLTHL